MNKNDKLVAIFGVIILIISSIGIFTFVPGGSQAEKVGIDEFLQITGTFSQEIAGTSITVPDTNPFYPLIATPLAVHYDAKGEQEIIPIYVENQTDPSKAIDKLKDYYLEPFDELIDGKMEYTSEKDFSLQLAEKFWKKSEGALLLSNDFEGYELGVNAVPLASYLSMPVIVCDEIDSEVTSVLSKLGVKKVVVCGNQLEGYKDNYQYLEFENVDHIVDNLIDVVKNKFDTLDYITMTNPIDAWPPQVLDSKEVHFEKTTIASWTMVDGLRKFVGNAGGGVTWDSFEIPKDYKYALIELEGINHNYDGVEEYGDRAYFKLDPVDMDEAPLTGMNGISTAHTPQVKDGKGNIIEDRAYTERVMYDCGGKEYVVSARGKWAVDEEGDVSAKVTIHKLEHPMYSMMQKHSVLAPYLTAYHKGIVFGKQDFAFVADDDVITSTGETCPGFYLPGRNLELTPMSNRHVFDNIHKPLNNLLSNIAGINYEKKGDLSHLQNRYQQNPIYVSLLGGHTGLPRLYYDNDVEPLDDPFYYGFGGGGTQSDNIYGNIDPVEYDYSNMANDIYTEYPMVENIVGRIASYDVQDAAALISRNIFYQDMLQIKKLTQWQENFGNLYGGGLDFQKPLPWYIVSKIPGVQAIANMIGLIDATGPWKLDTGFGEIGSQAVSHEIGENLGFDVELAYDAEGMKNGFSNEAINEMKNKHLRNKLFFDARAVKDLVGEGNVKGEEVLENSNFIFITAHGAQHNFGLPGPEMVSTGFKGLLGIFPYQPVIERFFTLFAGGFWGPGGDLGKVGDYTARSISELDLGPSFLWLESCFVGKINGLYPKTAIVPSFIHSGTNSVIASTTGSNIPGGYLEPKNFKFDTRLSNYLSYREWSQKAEQGEFPDFHFGMKIYNDLCENLKTDDVSIGLAFRNARNRYLPEDADWELWWNPPLSSGGDSGYGPQMPAKYTSYHEYVLYGDPAFNPYEPVNQG
ncbi:MAG: hypothetical protein KGY50_00230 [Candidatus Thermoplasmatota archaeon]|nr:hypothetical protein [Candidatus Thermoplasmatota archaeon]